jgi:nucleoside-diphosphate kinase
VAQRTLIIVKPDGVQRGLVGEVLGRLERRGLKLVGLKLMAVDRSLAETHYAVHKEKPFFADLIEFITAAPVVCAVVEGPEAIAVVRALVGATKFTEAEPGSIRGDYALDLTMNLIHASDAPDTAQKEIDLFFQPAELLDYARESDRWITSE